jgi:hypothetical protein
VEKIVGKVHKTAKGHLTYDIEELEAYDVFPIATALQEKFGFRIGKFPGLDPDELYIELFRNSIKILIGWDIWSGLFIMAMDESGDPVIREIGQYLDEVLDTIIAAKGNEKK